MNFNDVFNSIPSVMAIVVCLNSVMVALYAGMIKIQDQASIHPDNKYLQLMSNFSVGAMKVLDVFGYHPKRPEIEQKIKKNRKDINLLKKAKKK